MATTAPKPMDLLQASQRIAWLDEERRRDHAEVARLTQELTGVVALLKDQAIKQRETGDRLNAIEAVLTRIPRLEDAITSARVEMVPLREADVRLREDVQRLTKDRQTQADQAARYWSDVTARLEAVVKSIDGLSGRLQVQETQRKDSSERTADLGLRIDKSAAAAEALVGRIQLLEAREKDRAGREGEVGVRLNKLTSAADALGESIRLLEQRDKEHITRAAGIQAQVVRVEATHGQVVDGVQRGLARVEGLVSDIQQIRRDAVAAQTDVGKQYKELVSSLTAQGEAVAGVQRQVDELAAGQEGAQANVQELLAQTYALNEALGRLGLIEESIATVQSALKSFQEIQDGRWGEALPELHLLAEEAHGAAQTNAAAVQELMAAGQAIKEDVRQLRVNLAEEHRFSEDLATVLRGLMEEDMQTRLVMAQKQLQTIRRLANAPVATSQQETAPSHEQT